MSSAILYVAIVAIWACVLIPRWLRRDSPLGMAFTAGAEVPDEAGFPDAADDGGLAVDEDAEHDEEPVVQPDIAEMPRPAPAPMTAEESRRRMLSARRRLLVVLSVLEAAAVTFAVSGLVAMWVVALPSVMLLGYLLLLREAAQADAERAQRELDAQARPVARERARAQAAWRATAADATAAEPDAAAAAFAGRFAAAPVPADYEDSAPGRDFAPGLAGKYTPSYADSDPVDEDYDSYDRPRLRAVGD